ncbi:MAG: hypothetical protein ACRD2W_05720 [Acidimicrobiales bacterium]
MSVGVVVVIIAALLFAGGDDGEEVSSGTSTSVATTSVPSTTSTTRGTTTSTTTGGGGANAAEQQLLNRVPSTGATAFRSTCKALAETDKRGDFRGIPAIYCEPSSALTMYYYQLPNPNVMNDEYNDIVSSNTIPRGVCNPSENATFKGATTYTSGSSNRARSSATSTPTATRAWNSPTTPSTSTPPSWPPTTAPTTSRSTSPGATVAR